MMDADMQRVEMTLSDMSGKCNSKALGKILMNHGRFDQSIRAAGP